MRKGARALSSLLASLTGGVRSLRVRLVDTAQFKRQLDQLLADDCGRHCEPGHYASTPCRKKDDGKCARTHARMHAQPTRPTRCATGCTMHPAVPAPSSTAGAVCLWPAMHARRFFTVQLQPNANIPRARDAHAGAHAGSIQKTACTKCKTGTLTSAERPPLQPSR